jgi:hypothetical protein
MRALKQLPYGKCRGSLWDADLHDALASTRSIGAGARARSRRRADVEVCPLKGIGQALLRAVGGAIHLWVTRSHRRIVNPGGIGSRQQCGYIQHCGYIMSNRYKPPQGLRIGTLVVVAVLVSAAKDGIINSRPHC